MNKRVFAGVLAFRFNGKGGSLTVALLVTLHASTKNSFGTRALLDAHDSRHFIHESDGQFRREKAPVHHVVDNQRHAGLFVDHAEVLDHHLVIRAEEIMHRRYLDGIAARVSLTQARSSSGDSVCPSPVEPPTARLSARSRTRNSTWLRMEAACNSPSAAKGVVMGAMTPNGIFSGKIMIGTGSGVFDLA